MLTWSNTIVNKALSPLSTRQKYHHSQLYQILRDFTEKQKKIEDILEEDVKEG